LVNPVDARLKELLAEKTAALDMSIRALEVMPDHVHLFLDFDPRWGIAEIVNRLKGYTSRQLREDFPLLKSRLPTLWSRSYFAATTGCVSDATFERYIKEQKGK
jgi:putative transposase